MPTTPFFQELATRVPLIVSLPHHPRPGTTSSALVEHLDIYPTLADAAGLPIPSAAMGLSMLPLLEGGEGEAAAWNASYSQILRGKVMGYSMRTDRWRVTRWGGYDPKTGRPDFVSAPVGVELYDHLNDTESDFDAFENRNLATNPAYKDTLNELIQALETTWDNGVLPSPSPSPPVPPGPRFQLVTDNGGVCLVAGAHDPKTGNKDLTSDSDAVSTQACAHVVDSSSEWVAMAATGRTPQIASVGHPGYCLNVYGGLPAGCHSGVKIHLNECGSQHVGNWLRYNHTSSLLVIAAGGHCPSLCVDARADGSVALAPCTQASRPPLLLSASLTATSNRPPLILHLMSGKSEFDV